MKEQDSIPAVMKKFFFVKKKTFPACGFCRSNKNSPGTSGPRTGPGASRV